MTIARSFVVCASVVAFSAAALGGDLNPPPGPVAPTDRVRIHPESFGTPIVIDEPGSYVLTGPVLDCIGCDDLPNSGIVISASDVTLDCNGFAIVGDPENSLNGIFIDFGMTNVVIRDGIVRNWSSNGIVGGSGVSLESMRVLNNGHTGGADGVTLASESRVLDCVAQGNGGAGIFVGFGSTVRGCTSTGNVGDGIHTTVGALSNGSVVEGCVARNNGGIGFSLGDGTLASSCAASQNGGAGMIIGPGGAASGCTAVLNGGDGIGAVNALVHGCSAFGNTGSDIALSGGATAADSHDAP